MGLALSTKKVVREDTQPRAVRWPDVPNLECLSFLPSFPFLFFGGFNLKPPHNTQHKEKKKCKNLCVQGHRGLYPWCSFTLSEALPAQSWDLVDQRMDGPEDPGLGSLGPAWLSLGVAVHGGPRHFALWIISFSNKWTICSRKALPAHKGHFGRTSAHVCSEEILL